MTREAEGEERYPSIESYALLSDCHGSALVSFDGSVDWCCLPRFDARPVFARLLDWDRGGYFSIAAADEYTVERRYVPGTNVLETRFDTGSGVLVLTDFMALDRIEPADDPLLDEPRMHAQDRLVRLIRAEDGPVGVKVEYRPRFDFGATIPHTSTSDNRLLATYGGADALLLQSPVPLTVEDADAHASFTLGPGEELCFALSYELPHQLRRQRVDERALHESRKITCDYWLEWSGRLSYEGPYREAVERSALVLKGLMNLPTGAMVAAPTTSLPEEVGGIRNWDYRYTWLRDAAHVLEALFQLGYTAEAEAFMAWLHRTTAGRPEQIQIMYGVSGERFLPEVEVPDMAGYRDSAPVRVGNAAARQFQLDVYGDLLDLAWRHRSHGGSVDDDVWAVLRGVVDHVADNWERPDHGIWEVRTEPRHFVHSKIMAWVALDRGVRLAEERTDTPCRQRWKPVREAIRARILKEGVDDEGRFQRAFDLPGPDSAALLIPLLGLLPHDDERVRRTREWIADELREDDLLYRYLGPDGLPGSEGAFLACSFWLVEHLTRAGEVSEARRIFESLLERRNDVGLLAEEVHTGSGSLRGNFPQALSHIGLINAALALSEARSGMESERSGPGPAPALQQVEAQSGYETAQQRREP